MATRLLLISDTHIPGRARRLPDAVLRAADAADLVIHAGDWVSASVLDELARHGEVLGVWGNNDGADLRARLPEVARRTIEGVRFAVVHETGPSQRREARMDGGVPRHRCAGVRPQPHPVGHRGARRAAAAQSRARRPTVAVSPRTR